MGLKESKEQDVQFYNSVEFRDEMLMKGIKIFTIDELKEYNKIYKMKEEKKKYIVYSGLKYKDEKMLCWDFARACHYKCKEMINIMIERFKIGRLKGVIAGIFEENLEDENYEICELLINKIEMRNETYINLFKKNCEEGKINIVRWIYKNCGIEIKKIKLMGIFLEKIWNNKHYDVVRWLIEEVKCTENINLIERFNNNGVVEIKDE